MDDRIKRSISSRDWWYGVAGNILSTVLGIALTIGIAGLVDRYKDRKQSREMMFNVIQTARDVEPTLKQADSILKIEAGAAFKLIVLSQTNHGDLSKVSADTLSKYVKQCYKYANYSVYSSKTDSYFYSAQMMHQFQNPEVYAYFSTYVEFDKKVQEEIDNIKSEAIGLQRIVRSRVLGSVNDENAYADIVESLIKDNTLPDYLAFLLQVNPKHRLQTYQQYFDGMLMEMDADKEEFEKYSQKYSLVNKDQVMTLK